MRIKLAKLKSGKVVASVKFNKRTMRATGTSEYYAAKKLLRVVLKMVDATDVLQYRTQRFYDLLCRDLDNCRF